ncbi:hypothetical protein M231_02377 [Tremella mesenterica]|uniref:Uncharacterized protein n=2 Tax=Tremella mesenterica TaxID=5217 RepID=A0A4Q1BR14_TREME|nr:hypothetical protein M231_02377 [Tremella mesenterica]
MDNSRRSSDEEDEVPNQMTSFLDMSSPSFEKNDRDLVDQNEEGKSEAQSHSQPEQPTPPSNPSLEDLFDDLFGKTSSWEGVGREPPTKLTAPGIDSNLSGANVAGSSSAIDEQVQATSFGRSIHTDPSQFNAAKTSAGASTRSQRLLGLVRQQSRRVKKGVESAKSRLKGKQSVKPELEEVHLTGASTSILPSSNDHRSQGSLGAPIPRGSDDTTEVRQRSLLSEPLLSQERPLSPPLLESQREETDVQTSGAQKSDVHPGTRTASTDDQDVDDPRHEVRIVQLTPSKQSLSFLRAPRRVSARALVRSLTLAPPNFLSRLTSAFRLSRARPSSVMLLPPSDRNIKISTTRQLHTEGHDTTTANTGPSSPVSPTGAIPHPLEHWNIIS